MLNENFKTDSRREIARIEDNMELAKAVKDGVFDWDKRYDAQYVCAYAIKHGLNQGRLKKAIERVDEDWRKHARHHG